MNEKNKGGRPLLFKTVAELEKRIEEYFESCFDDLPVTDSKGVFVKDKDGNVVFKRQQIKPFTITGLAVYLDCDRDTLVNYEAREDENGEQFFGTIKRAKNRIEEYAEQQLYRLGNNGGVIFNLKNNYGWIDKREHEDKLTFPEGIPEPHKLPEGATGKDYAAFKLWQNQQNQEGKQETE